MSEKYECKLCCKKYISYNTLWVHNKKYHKDGLIIKKSPTDYSCIYCKRNFNTNYSVKIHQDKCKYKDSPKLTNKNL